MEDFLRNPRKLRERTPSGWYGLFQENGYGPRPLGRGSLAGVAFEDGGGYRVNWDSNKLFLYHPEKRSHHGGAYYKLSSGVKTARYDLNGMPLKGEEA